MLKKRKPENQLTSDRKKVPKYGHLEFKVSNIDPQTTPTKQRKDVISDSSSYLVSSPVIDNQMNESKSKIMQEIERESQLIDEKLSQSNQHYQELVRRFAEIQKIAKGFHVSFAAPELVAIGGQSDGKSSFVEALCGFQFNCVDSNIGTRRPLIIQMFNDLTAETPQCRFYTEDLKQLEPKNTPIDKIEGEIRQRTTNLCGEHDVSSRPIMMRITYKLASNLTIYDLPGFRKAKDDPYGKKIQELVKTICKKPTRILCCLEQSTVEWVNTQVRPIVEELDPQFKRTIFVATKFNNRNNQFRSADDIHKYMSSNEKATDKVFFISLPSGPDASGLSPSQFQRAIKKIYLKDLKLCLQLGFDQKFRPFLGFYRLKFHLEKLLYQKYQDSVHPVYEKLQSLQESLQKKLLAQKSIVDQCKKEDASQVMNKLMNAFVRNLHLGLKGTAKFYQVHEGFTLQEEKQNSHLGDWPTAQKLNLTIRNQDFKLYGGAQLERLLTEFAIVGSCQEFPSTSNDEVAISIGLNHLHTNADWDHAASEITRRKFASTFQPLVKHLVQRSEFCMHALAEIVGHFLGMKADETSRIVLKKVQDKVLEFNRNALNELENRLMDEIQEMTSVIDFHLLSAIDMKPNYDLLDPTEEDTKNRVVTTMDQEGSVSYEFGKKRTLDSDLCMKIKLAAARLFGAIREIFLRFVRSKYHSVFIRRVFDNIQSWLREELLEKVSSNELHSFVFSNLTEVEASISDITAELHDVSQELERFQKLSNFVSQESETE